MPEAQLRALPEVVTGLDVVELGCGTAYFSAWLARRGARPVVYMDRSYDPANAGFGVTLARLAPDTQAFSHTRVDTGLSDPDHARWFAGATHGQTTFLGDYNGLAVGADDTAHPFWTDMRRVVTVGGASGTTEDVFSAAVR